MSKYQNMLLLLESFEQYLGDPKQKTTPVNFHQCLQFDEQNQLDWEQMKYLQDWGFMDYLIPTTLGGKMNSLEELFLLSKLVARRDCTLSIALGLSFFAALPIWSVGDEAQKKKLAKRISEGAIGAFALTEESHGTDLTSNELSAKPLAEGWELNGKKWCVNFATHGQLVTVLCRTHEKGGLRGFSLFFLDKETIGPGYVPTAKLPTHGVRGLDISGFSLEKLKVPTDSLIGNTQQGLEIVYKVFQISRTLLTCLSLGGADTALRLALSYSLERQLYGKSAVAIPVVRQRLAEQFSALLIADSMALAMVRACTIMPEKMCLWSAITKYLIPKMGEDIVEQCAIVLGARAYLRTTQWAIFQKIRRDVQVVGLFDGSSQVNLALIAGNLLPQARMRGIRSESTFEKLEQIFDFSADCPDFNGQNLGLFIQEEDDIIAGLSLLNAAEINPLIELVLGEIRLIDEEVLQLQAQKNFDPRSLTAFRLAERYCWLFAASCCLHVWFFNRSQFNDECKNQAWIHLALQLILNKLQSTYSIDPTLQEAMVDSLLHYHQQNRLFSVLPLHIAEF